MALYFQMDISDTSGASVTEISGDPPRFVLAIVT